MEQLEPAKYAVYDQHVGGWLTDTCAGGSFSWNVINAVWFDSEYEAQEALRAADMRLDCVIVRVK